MRTPRLIAGCFLDLELNGGQVLCVLLYFAADLLVDTEQVVFAGQLHYASLLEWLYREYRSSLNASAELSRKILSSLPGAGQQH